ncbi:hypothetical protein MUK42_11360 [Musa troglodytarum]|uniref:Uncharacterized protein n=1 Tax=Musa troglodytarum TaxID=320322 RepID=A0A9E7HS64_9LILI|nr:hypothetical protein MUK42_11360 [Musa troglodytarum]
MASMKMRRRAESLEESMATTLLLDRENWMSSTDSEAKIVDTVLLLLQRSDVTTTIHSLQ